MFDCWWIAQSKAVEAYHELTPHNCSEGGGGVTLEAKQPIVFILQFANPLAAGGAGPTSRTPSVVEIPLGFAQPLAHIAIVPKRAFQLGRARR